MRSGVAGGRQEKKYFGRSDSEPLEVVNAQGCYIVDSRGKCYLDFLAGWNVGNLGWKHPVLEAALASFHGPDYVYPELHFAPWEELAEQLAELAPGRLSKAFRATGGTEAVELALQAAMLHTGRRGFVSLEGSYHGDSLATLSIGSTESREKLPNLLSQCHKLNPPLDDKAVGRLETLLKHRSIAAFIMEPIPISLGVLLPEPEFMAGAAQLCRRFDTLLIMDEVATGFGRTGKLFASEHFELEPDVLCLGKAITGGVEPMGATLTTAAVGTSLEKHGSIYSTYGWHPRSVRVASAALSYWKRERAGLLDHVNTMGSYFRQRLEKTFPQDGTIRTRGLAIAVEFERKGYVAKLVKHCRESGLLVSQQDEQTLTMFPALTISEEAAVEGLDILDSCAS